MSYVVLPSLVLVGAARAGIKVAAQQLETEKHTIVWFVQTLSHHRIKELQEMSIELPSATSKLWGMNYLWLLRDLESHGLNRPELLRATSNRETSLCVISNHLI